MKRCPACQRAYDDLQSFCTEDGAILLSESEESGEGPPTVRYDPPPTELYTPPTPTGNAYAPPSQPGYAPGPASWQPSTPPNYAPPATQPPNFPAPAYPAPSRRPAPDQTLAILSFVCGLVSVVMFCFSGIVGVPAIILGVMARKRVEANPELYGGAGLALAGIICGGIGLSIMALYWLGIILSALTK